MAGCALRYQFVDERALAARAQRVSENATNVARTMDVSALEPDVRYLASPELQGRLRGTEGNARARVRGLAASMLASARRLNDMAADRAEIMATTIQAN